MKEGILCRYWCVSWYRLHRVQEDMSIAMEFGIVLRNDR